MIAIAKSINIVSLYENTLYYNIDFNIKNSTQNLQVV